MGDVILRFARAVVRCDEDGLVRRHEPGVEIPLPRSVAASYVRRGRGRIVRECQTHTVPDEVKISFGPRRILGHPVREGEGES